MCAVNHFEKNCADEQDHNCRDQLYEVTVSCIIIYFEEVENVERSVLYFLINCVFTQTAFSVAN